MRSFWCITVMISVLFMSVDGAADSVIKGHAHGAILNPTATTANGAVMATLSVSQ